MVTSQRNRLVSTKVAFSNAHFFICSCDCDQVALEGSCDTVDLLSCSSQQTKRGWILLKARRKLFILHAYKNWLHEELIRTDKYCRSLNQCITSQLHVLHKLMTYIMTQDGKLHTKKPTKIKRKLLVAFFSLWSPWRRASIPRTDRIFFSWAFRLFTISAK